MQTSCSRRGEGSAGRVSARLLEPLPVGSMSGLVPQHDVLRRSRRGELPYIAVGMLLHWKRPERDRWSSPILVLTRASSWLSAARESGSAPGSAVAGVPGARGGQWPWSSSQQRESRSMKRGYSQGLFPRSAGFESYRLPLDFSDCEEALWLLAARDGVAITGVLVGRAQCQLTG